MQLLLVVRQRYVPDVQVGVLGLFAVGPGERDLEALVLDLVAVEALDRLLRVLFAHELDKTVAKAVACLPIVHETARLDGPDLGKERIKVVLLHRLRQVVYDEVGAVRGGGGGGLVAAQVVL